MEQVELLVRQAYREKAWHGPNLRSSLRGVGVEEAVWRPASGRHSIWELVLHCAYWKQRVIARVTGTRESLPRKGTDWLEVPARADAAAWRADVRLLDEVHARLQSMVSALDARALSRKCPGRSRTRESELVGIAFHDVYHAGQVRLIRRLYGRRRSGREKRS